MTWALRTARTSKVTGAVSNFNYRLMARQKATESVAYFVLEHQPEKCNQLPPNGADPPAHARARSAKATLSFKVPNVFEGI